MPSRSPIVQFLSSFRRRLFFRSLTKSILWSLLVGGFFAVAYALNWRLQGRSVPTEIYWILLFWACFLAGLWALIRIRSKAEAAHEADKHFQLKDGLASSIQFNEEEREGEVYELQERRVEEQIDQRSPSSLPLQLPWKVAASATGLIALALWMATLPNSAAVEEQIQEEQLTLDKTTEVKQALEELMEELLKDLDEDELAEVDTEEMREWVKTLEETTDQKEALRQLARFEQKIAKTLKGLEARQDEQTLKLAAAELAKSDLSDARQLGKKLDSKDFAKAAEDLKNLKPGSKDPKGRKLSKEERKQMMKKLREATKRMANGAKNRSTNQQNKASQAKGENMVPLDQLLDELDQAAAELDGQLEDLPEIEGEFELGEFDDELGRFMRRMKKLDARNKLRGKLRAMRKQVGQCQSFCAGGAQKLGLAQGRSLPPGVGSQESNREGSTEMPDQMNAERLQGQKGQGPSQSTIEDADSGTGISGKRTTAKARDFSRQMESFVQRDDIPEDMKLGVREYFERIHQVETESTQTP